MTTDSATVRRSTRHSDQARTFDDRFADNLLAVRNRRKVSRQQLSQWTGIPWHTIEKIENGHGSRKGQRRPVTIGEAVVLAEALGVTPGDLLTRSVVTDV